MPVLCGTIIRYTCLLVHLIHLVDIDLPGGAAEGGELSGRYSHGVVDLVQSMPVAGLMSKD
jgi:hypothetical protein